MKTVLLIDDDPAFHRLVAHQLEGLVHVLGAQDPFQGLQQARRDRPDAILLDLSMPDLDGLSLLRRLREDPATAAIPVICVTANNSPETIVEALDAGAIDYLTKPVVQLTLQSRVRAALRHGPGTSDADLSGLDVLVIDDDPNLHNLIDLYLRKRVGRVLHAIKASMGQRIATEDKPDLILLDLNMPQIDGFEAYRLLRQDTRTATIPVIFITADDKPFRSAKAMDLGAADYIVKPVHEGVLLARLRAVLRREPAR